ncbi:MAG TPA: hypothetical protein VFX78_00740 [Candidatus Eisenbacteria bacterium]|nr:hypothetical protein [Candidatus Eisenbacteria bacterium]
MLDRFDLSVIYAGSFAVVLASILLGFVLGDFQRRRAVDYSEGPVGAVVGAMLGLLAFILAFTFGIVTSRFDTRKQLLLQDVNAIATATVRADLLPEPDRTECRALMKRYLDLRVEAIHDMGRIPNLAAESESLQVRLWDHAVTLARRDMNSDIGALFVESLNDLSNTHRDRFTVAMLYRIPSPIWFGLLWITIASMTAVGFQFGLAGRLSWIMMITLAITFSSVIVLIARIDRTGKGAILVDQQPMIELQRKLWPSGGPG